MKKVLLLLIICVNVLGQSVVIQPNSQGINTSNVQDNVLDVRGSGLIIQPSYFFSSIDPNLSINTLSCGVNPPYIYGESGIIKYPNAGQYSANANCQQGIQLLDYNIIAVKFTFEMLNTEASGDSVFINNFKFSGNSIPPNLILPGTKYTVFNIKFKSDGDGNLGNGFRIKWQTIFLNPPLPSPNENFSGRGFYFDNNTLAFRLGQMDVSSKVGLSSTAFGYFNIASGGQSTAFGINSTASGNSATSFGSSSEASGSNSLATGSFTNASASESFTAGQSTFAKAKNGFVIGSYNDVTDNPTNFADPTDRIFQVGNGDFTTRKNALTILRNGRAGFGTSTLTLNTDERMEINGRLRIRDSTSTAGVWFNNSANSISHLDGAFHGMKTNTETGIFIGGNWRFWVNNSGNANFTGTVTATGFPIASDFRYKKNIQPLENTLSKVQKIVGVSYDLRKDEFPEKNFSDKRQIGFIAQDLEKIFPEMVFTDEKGYKSVDYARLTPVLVEAVKELTLKNQTLENKNQTLSSRLDKIEAMLTAIQPNTENSNSKK